MIEWEKFWYKQLYRWNIWNMLTISPFNLSSKTGWKNWKRFFPQKVPFHRFALHKTRPRWHLPLKQRALVDSQQEWFSWWWSGYLRYGRLVYICKNWKSFTNWNPKVRHFWEHWLLNELHSNLAYSEFVKSLQKLQLKNWASWLSIGKKSPCNLQVSFVLTTCNQPICCGKFAQQRKKREALMNKKQESRLKVFWRQTNILMILQTFHAQLFRRQIFSASTYQHFGVIFMIFSIRIYLIKLLHLNWGCLSLANKINKQLIPQKISDSAITTSLNFGSTNLYPPEV